MRLKKQPSLQDVAAYPRAFETRILYSDMDGFRHVNNIAIGRYFEEGRADLNMAAFGTACMIDPPAGEQLLFATVTIDYLRQVHYPGRAHIASGVAQIGTTSFVIVQAGFQDGSCFALAESVMVKAGAGRPSALDLHERDALEALRVRGGVVPAAD